MRLNIKTTPNSSIIPYNYQQKLTGVLHKWLGENNQEHGEVSLYSFSWLRNMQVSENGLTCPKGASFFLSFYDTQRLKDVLANIRKEPEMFCGMSVKDVVIEDTPDLTQQEQFNLGSPILIKRKENDKIAEFYYDNSISGKLLEETLRTKMRLAGIPDDDTLSIAFDLNYTKKKTKLVWYDNISNKANMCPVIIKGRNQTKQFAWNVGLGNCTGIGFGSIY
jgi:CRISPR-associated endoribonuclease Cas6